MSLSAMLAERVDSFQQSWGLTRALSLDLLNSLDEESLLFSPGANLGDFWKQFRHLGRVQESYITALRTRRAEFGTISGSYNGDGSKSSLDAYLRLTDTQLQQTLDSMNWQETIDWRGEKIDVFSHLNRMMGHERLHQGQFIVYMRLLGRHFPTSWSIWGL